MLDKSMVLFIKKDEKTEKRTKPGNLRLNSDKVLFSFARDRERCDRNGHAVFLRPGVCQVFCVSFLEKILWGGEPPPL